MYQISKLFAQNGKHRQNNTVGLLVSSFDIELISPIKRVLKAIPDPEETGVWNKTISVTSANLWLFSIKRITKFRSLDTV